MQVSWNWLSELVDLKGLPGPGGPSVLADLLTSRGLEVEEIRAMGQGLERVITAQILERNPHPNSDRLSLCKVTIGGDAPLEIVCGAQNMKAGDKVVLAQIGAALPNGLKIGESKIRGVASQGMLCSEEELKFKDASDGILILPAEAPLGKPLAEYLGLDDTVLTLKLTANRGDCLSHFGIAREVAAALGQKPKRPSAAPLEMKGSPIRVSLDAEDGASQFWGCQIDGVKVGPSPKWLVKKLESVGSRSINNVVDASNLVMLELGHPVHAYDAERIEGKSISVRLAKAGEALPLLDGSSVVLTGSELVIADAKRAVGLAGIMGGGNSEVKETTQSVFLEVAEFAASLVRRAASLHQKRTDASHRFERGVDPAGVPHALARFASLVTELAGGKVVGATSARLASREAVITDLGRRRISVRADYFREFLGMDLSRDEIRKTLIDLDCSVEGKGDEWIVLTPSYRLDLNLKEDLAEEVARTVGYDKIPSTIPTLSSPPTPVNSDENMSGNTAMMRAKRALEQAGLTETVNFAFTRGSWLEEFGMKSGVRLINPLSEELEWMVPSLIPGLVRNVVDNGNRNFGSEALPIRLFELRPTYHGPAEGGVKARGEMDTGVGERWMLSFAISGPRYAGGLKTDRGEVDFFDVRGVVEGLFEALGTKGVRFQSVTSTRQPSHPMVGLLHPGQSVEILAGKEVAGYFGLAHPGRAKGWKLRAPLWIGELDWAVVARMSRGASDNRSFRSWSEYPSMERDFALIVGEGVTAERITQVVIKAGKPLAKVAKIFDVYRGSQVTEGMTSVAVRVIFFEEGRSLQEAETDAASKQILEALRKELGAELRA